MGGINTLQRHDVQQAAFVVLKEPDIPSVLVETAFITNPREEKLLASTAYQERKSTRLNSSHKCASLTPSSADKKQHQPLYIVPIIINQLSLSKVYSLETNVS